MLDRESYEQIWEKLIKEEMDNYQKDYSGLIRIEANAKDGIWEAYSALNRYCRLSYMSSPDKKLDRHKVAACYMIAIVQSKPMRFLGEYKSSEILVAVNEMLAITVGFSIVCAFAVSAAKNNKSLTEEEKNNICDCFESGLWIPTNKYVNHGEYYQNFANELRLECADGRLGVLSLAHELFLLEVLTRNRKNLDCPEEPSKDSAS